MSKMSLDDLEDSVFVLVPITELRKVGEDPSYQVRGYHFFKSGDIFPIMNKPDGDMSLWQLNELFMGTLGESVLEEMFYDPFSDFLSGFFGKKDDDSESSESEEDEDGEDD